MSEQESKLLLKEMTRKKIHYLLSKHSVKDVDVYTVIKEFFKEYLQARYEFTFEELHEEFKKVYLEKHVKDELFSIIDLFNTVEYEDEPVPHRMLKEVLERFDLLLEHLIVQQPKRTMIHKLLGLKPSPITPPPLKQAPLETRVLGVEHKRNTASEVPPSSPSVTSTTSDRTQVVQKEPLNNKPSSKAPSQSIPLTPSPHPQKEVDLRPLDEKYRPVDKHKLPVNIEKTSWIEPDEGSGSGQQGGKSASSEKVTVSESWTKDVRVEKKDAEKNVLLSELLGKDENDKSNSLKKNPQGTQSDEYSEQLDMIVSRADKHDQINDLLYEAQMLVDQKELVGAKKKYKELLDAYNDLPEHERHEHFDQVNTLYSSLTSTAQ